jgi:hypothetical protein
VLRTVALSGNLADSGGGPAMSFVSVGAPSINDAGEIAFTGMAQQTGQAAQGGVWSEGGGLGVRLLALNGNAMPGIAGGSYSGLESSFPSINEAGQTTYRAFAPTGGSITTSNNSAMWVAAPGQTPVLRQRKGDVAPGAAGGVFDTLSDVLRQRYSAFNNAGQITGFD